MNQHIGIGCSKEVPPGGYAVSKEKEDGIYSLLECTNELAFSWFGSGLVRALVAAGEKPYIILNPDDLRSGYWGIQHDVPEDET